MPTFDPASLADMRKKVAADTAEASKPQSKTADESNPHDPTGAIFAANVRANEEAQRVIREAAQKALTKQIYAEDENDSQHKVHKTQLTLPKVTQISRILKQYGMDSQQAGHALKEIMQVVES